MSPEYQGVFQLLKEVTFAGDLCAHSGSDKTVGLVRGNSARKELALNATTAPTLVSRNLLLRTTTHLTP